MRQDLSPDDVRYVNGDFSIELHRGDNGWVVSGAVERNRRSRSLWWLWLVVGLIYLGVAITLTATHNRHWLWGLGALPIVGARFFFRLSHRLRRGGTRVPLPPLYDRD